MMNFLAKFYATTFFSGHSKFAPGTVGAMIALGLYWLMPVISWYAFVALIILLFFTGVWASSIAENFYGHDAGKINIDEVVGMMMSLVALPKTGWVLLAAFILFRFFDIVKLYPINLAQNRLPRGWGVMMDDVLAGVYTNVIMQVIIAFWKI